MNLRSLVLATVVAHSYLLGGCSADIAYTRNGELRRLHCGSDQPIAVGTTANEGPQWSPDDTRLAYLGMDSGRNDIFLLTAATKTSWHTNNLTAGATAVPTVDFSWSPDGRWIFYTAVEPGGLQAIYRVLADPAPGTTVPPPMRVSPPGVNSKNPTVSPDSNRIAYSATSLANPTEYHLHTSNIAGTNQATLTFAPGSNDIMPAYGPDGRLVYVREPSTVLIIEPVYPHQQLTPTFAGLGSYSRPDRPVWSPNGDYIAYTGGGGKIYVVSSRAPYAYTCITCSSTAPPGLNIDQNPRWSAGSERLVFHRPVHDIPPLGNPEGLFSIRRDGTEETFLSVDGRRPHSQARSHWCRTKGP